MLLLLLYISDSVDKLVVDICMRTFYLINCLIASAGIVQGVLDYET